MPNPEIESLLRDRIDDLSPGSPQPFQAALAELGRQAGEAGYGGAARIAGELSASPPLTADLQEGLAPLQQALSDGPGDAAPAPQEPARPKTVSALADDPELVSDFIVESREHLTTIEQRLLTLEREPGDADAINSVFRGFHTIKGLAGFLEFAPIQEMAHEVETALNLVREGKLAINPAVADVILESVDYLSRAI